MASGTTSGGRFSDDGATADSGAGATMLAASTDVIEKRIFYRLTIALPLRYQLVTAARHGGPEHGSCLNLSAGGMLLRTRTLDEATSDDLLSGQGRIVIDVQLPGTADEMRITARALWMEDDGDTTRIGVRFLDLGAAAQELVQQFVLRHSLG